MRSVLQVLFMSSMACTSLEDRVEIFNPEWCVDIDDATDPDHKGAPRRATAECIIDGDTFYTVDCEQTPGPAEEMRLLGPDTPEKAGVEVNGVVLIEDQCYAQEATDFLARALEGRLVRLEFDETCVGLYGRRLVYVFISVDIDDPLRPEIDDFGDLIPESEEAEEVLVNEWMLRAGVSDIWEQFGSHNPDARYADRFYEAREKAALAGLGGWSACQESTNVFPNG